ncbi:glycoside hydrolase family 43 protein [Cylindrobasidium torrendii FP15055 ss-10]|uniref:Arabinan endo-1,5-alpha-L-arabinosidase n=1 Tax=Cylindrobasidium torrendii FP15055 ss-10 TaxID=1314674 RepID=A0A0D7BJK7_9AGAR|nr:glycoside hydrolase family 43 protein [Cylindrobasidium torrendii FP15055 ss-10]
MSSPLILKALLVGLLSVVANAYVGPGKVTGVTTVHDPSMCKRGDGTYFIFSTAPGIQIITSKDRTAWTSPGVMFPNGAATWTDAYTGTSNGNLWAPDCYWDGNQFWVWYSASSFGSRVSAIFLATSTTGNPGTWSNKGLVTSTTNSSNYNAIDPNLIRVSNSAWYLTFGSFWTGIKIAQLHPSNGMLYDSTVTSLASRSNNAVEGSSLYSHGGYYYLFTSWDACCKGTSSTYNIRVGRSKTLLGPYVDASGVSLLNGGGTLVLPSHDGITGPGGQDIFEDTDGPLLVYHYYTSSGSYLGINLLDFSSGWPVVA